MMKSLFSIVSKNSVWKRIIDFRKMLNAIKLGFHSFYRSLQQKESNVAEEEKYFLNFKKSA